MNYFRLPSCSPPVWRPVHLFQGAVVVCTGDTVDPNSTRVNRERRKVFLVEADVTVEVVCYAGYKGDERPVPFRLAGQDYFVEELLDQWYGPHNVFLKSARE